MVKKKIVREPWTPKEEQVLLAGKKSNPAANWKSLAAMLVKKGFAKRTSKGVAARHWLLMSPASTRSLKSPVRSVAALVAPSKATQPKRRGGVMEFMTDFATLSTKDRALVRRLVQRLVHDDE